MKTKRLSITEKDFDLNASKEMIIRAIDSQINNYKYQYLTNWEKDHTLSPVEKDEKIKALLAEREDVIELCKAFDSEDSLVDVNISIDVTIKETLSVMA